MQKKSILNHLSHELTTQEASIQKITHYQQQLAKIQQEWDALSTNWLSLDQVNNLFNNIESLVKQSGVSLTHISVDDAITITLSSDYISLLNFIGELSTRSYFLITDLQLKRDSGTLLTVICLHILLSDS